MDLIVGQTAFRSITLTAEHVRAYAEMTGDYNPLHFDEGFASRTKFGKLVVQGGLTTGLLHALVAMNMPGPGTVFLSQTGSSRRRCLLAIPSPPRQKWYRYMRRNRSRSSR